MSEEETRRIGLIIGREQDWPDAFMTAVNERQDNVTAEWVQLGGTFMDEPCDYHVIIDRASHEIPYYRAYLQYAALQGCYVINNPFTWSADNKAVSVSLVSQLGLANPRTVLLPNKHVEMEAGPDCFRNLKYPMDWEAIIEYVGVPAIFKDAHSFGRRPVFRVNNVDELIQRYDESSTHTKILQQVIESDNHIHCFVIGQENVLALRYSIADGRYLPGSISTEEPPGKELHHNARAISRAYQYDVNMVEFVVSADTLYVINGTNPAPVIDRDLMTPDQFTWLINEMANLAIERAKRPLKQRAAFTHVPDTPPNT